MILKNMWTHSNDYSQQLFFIFNCKLTDISVRSPKSKSFSWFWSFSRLWLLHAPSPSLGLPLRVPIVLFQRWNLRRGHIYSADWWWQSPLGNGRLKTKAFSSTDVDITQPHMIRQAEVFCRSLLSRAWPVNHPWRRHTLTRRTPSSAFTRSLEIMLLFSSDIRLFASKYIVLYTPYTILEVLAYMLLYGSIRTYNA